MHIREVKYLKGVIGTDPLLNDGKKQVAFLGRSNAGKSTLINMLTGVSIARSSKYPGRTKRIDIFHINKSFYFVDLPGYGYAKLSGIQHEQIRIMILWYLLYAEITKRLIILVIDAYVGFTDFDRETIAIFQKNEIPFIIAAHKIDKIQSGKSQLIIEKLRSEYPNTVIIPSSIKKKVGKRLILTEIENFLKSASL